MDCWGLLRLIIQQSRPPILARLPAFDRFGHHQLPKQLTGNYSLTMKVDDMYSLLDKKTDFQTVMSDDHKLSMMFKGSSSISFHTHCLRPRFIRAMLPTMWCGTTSSMMIQCPKLIRLVSSIVPSLGATAP